MSSNTSIHNYGFKAAVETRDVKTTRTAGSSTPFVTNVLTQDVVEISQKEDADGNETRASHILWTNFKLPYAEMTSVGAPVVKYLDGTIGATATAARYMTNVAGIVVPPTPQTDYFSWPELTNLLDKFITYEISDDPLHAKRIGFRAEDIVETFHSQIPESQDCALASYDRNGSMVTYDHDAIISIMLYGLAILQGNVHDLGLAVEGGELGNFPSTSDGAPVVRYADGTLGLKATAASYMVNPTNMPDHTQAQNGHVLIGYPNFKTMAGALKKYQLAGDPDGVKRIAYDPQEFIDKMHAEFPETSDCPLGEYDGDGNLITWDTDAILSLLWYKVINMGTEYGNLEWAFDQWTSTH